MRRRRYDIKFPPPPPTPEGYVYASKISTWGQKYLELVKAEELQAACIKFLGMLDELSPKERQRVYETGEVPERQTVQVNRAVSAFGIALARPK